MNWRGFFVVLLTFMGTQSVWKAMTTDSCGEKLKKIVLTGGPSSGKSSVIEALRDSGFILVPEVAGIVISGGSEALFFNVKCHSLG